jgi:BlaI family transcriptional regulator, penicillinase repressor
MSKTPPKRDFDLGDAELAVLRVLWDHGPQTVREVMQHMHDRGRRVAYTTVLTFLTRLEQKGVVRSDKTDVAYVYRAKASRASVTKTRVKALLEELYDGAAGPVVMHLIENERLTADEIVRLRKLIKDLDEA